ncbi:MAG: ABC transporter permease subunit [Lewinellaceae bacterium]|nr:ABC transporter permease subunit [Saprospiraceae bacterium]MCB9330526.1 ABC transporter permease subunit [Lewinellaceae bacterium]
MLFLSTYNEFIKIAAKPRSYLGLGAITVLVGVILLALKADGMSFISFVTASFEQTLSFQGNILNGNLVAFIILQMLIIHIPLLVALVTGDLVSGEAASGTIRMLLTKPISRTHLLLSKFIAGGVYTLCIIVWLGFMSVVLGKVMFGSGDLMVLNSDGLIILQKPDVNWRYIGGFTVAFLALLTVSSLSICLSCFTSNSIGPIVTTMAIIILFTIIGTLDVRIFDHVRPYLFTTHMAAWRSFFEEPFPKADILKSVGILLVHNVALIGISLYSFNKKDITA